MLAGDTPLIDAVRNGRVGVVAAMLADGGYGVNEPMTNGLAATPLYVACEKGHTEVVTKLIAANATTRSVIRFVQVAAVLPPRAAGAELTLAVDVCVDSVAS